MRKVGLSLDLARECGMLKPVHRLEPSGALWAKILRRRVADGSALITYFLLFDKAERAEVSCRGGSDIILILHSWK